MPVKKVLMNLCLSTSLFVFSASAKQQPVSPIPTDILDKQNVRPANFSEPIYIPSPFAEEGQLTATPYWSGPYQNPDSHSLPLLPKQHRQSGATDASNKQIVIEWYTLLVDDATSDQIFQSLDPSQLRSTGGEIKPVADGLGNDQQVSSRELVLQGSPTVYGQISQVQFDEMASMLKGTAQNDMIQAPTVTTFENQLATMSDASRRPFVVRAIPKIDDQGAMRHIPVIQIIEEGTIARHRACVTDDGVQLDSKIILNQIEEVQEFQVSGNSSSATIQVPRCRCKQVDCTVNLLAGNLLLIDPNFVVPHEVRTEKRGFLTRRVGIERSTRKTLIVLKTTVVDSSH